MIEIDQHILDALSPDKLVAAYVRGSFPMVQYGELMWFNPEVRGMMPLDDRFHISRSLKRTINSNRFVCTTDRCFWDVVRICSRQDDLEGTWASAEMRIAYTALHELGLAHSIETWPAEAIGQGEPVGGLYGVTIGGAFFAESMFHRTTDAGKVALAYLIDRLRTSGFGLCDIQWTTANLQRFGAFDVSGDEYLTMLNEAVKRPANFA